MRCRFSQYCKHYQPKGYTCNHDDEAKTHCGIYLDFVDAERNAKHTDAKGNT